MLKYSRIEWSLELYCLNSNTVYTTSSFVTLGKLTCTVPYLQIGIIRVLTSHAFFWIELIYIKCIWHIEELCMLVVSDITNTKLKHATNCNRQTLKSQYFNKIEIHLFNSKVHVGVLISGWISSLWYFSDTGTFHLVTLSSSSPCWVFSGQQIREGLWG